MSHRRGRRSGSSDSELEDLKYKYYKDLRDERIRIKGSGKHLLCPYCRDSRRREYNFSELEKHASHIAKYSKSASFTDRARHAGLLKYLDRYYHKEKSSWLSNRNHEPLESYEDDKSNSVRTVRGTKSPWSREKIIAAVNDSIRGDDAMIQTTEGTTKPEEAEPGEIVTEIGDRAAELEDGELVTESSKVGMIAKDKSLKYSGRTSKRESCPRSRATTQRSASEGGEELFVWPWMAIIANIPVEKQNGRYVGVGGRKLKEEWISQGYNPTKVYPLWNFHGHSGFAIVEFNKDWEGFKNVMAFEKSFEMDNHGKKDWLAARRKGDKLYGWLARGEDYLSKGIIGTYLQKNGDLKTVADIQNEDRRKDTKLVCNLTNVLETKDKKCEEITNNISKTETFIGKVMKQKEEMVQRYNEELEKMQDQAYDQLRKMSEEHERSRMQLEAQRDELKLREKELKERQSLNEMENRKLQDQKNMNEMAIMEQKKADDRMMKLAEDQKRQKESLQREIIKLEAKLDEKQALELHIQRMKGAVEVMKHLSEGDMEDKKKLELIEEELRDKTEEYESLESLGQALIVKERKSNDELQDARKALINCLKDSRANSRANIGVKRMGELDEKPFVKAAKNKYADEDWAEKAMTLCSSWDECLRDPGWHPYKIVVVDGAPKEVLDENDEKLMELKTELGEEVYEAVIMSLNEMNECNPSGRYPVPVLWNISQKRKASLKEGIGHLLKQWKLHKAKRRRT